MVHVRVLIKKSKFLDLGDFVPGFTIKNTLLTIFSLNKTRLNPDDAKVFNPKTLLLFAWNIDSGIYKFP